MAKFFDDLTAPERQKLNEIESAYAQDSMTFEQAQRAYLQVLEGVEGREYLTVEFLSIAKGGDVVTRDE